KLLCQLLQKADHMLGVQGVAHFLSQTFVLHQAGFFQDAQMLGNKRLGKLGSLYQLAHALAAGKQRLDNAIARRAPYPLAEFFNLVAQISHINILTYPNIKCQGREWRDHFELIDIIEADWKEFPKERGA